MSKSGSREHERELRRDARDVGHALALHERERVVRRATVVMMKLVPPRRRLPGSFVMKPRCANDVPVKLRVPPPQPSPTSVAVMNASWRLV